MKTYRLLASLLMSATFVVSCTKEAPPPEEISASPEKQSLVLRPEQMTAGGIVVGTPEEKEIALSIHANGILDSPPQNLVTISAPLGGFIKSTHLLQGMRVRRGERLVTLQDAAYIQLQQDYLDTRSQLEFAESEYQRQTQLAVENVNAQKTLQQSKSNVESLRARVSGMEARLALINIQPDYLMVKGIQREIGLYSPIGGYVTEMNINLGQYVNATDVLFKIVDTRHLHVELYVFEQDIHLLQPDQPVTFKLINESATRTARVHLIGKEIGSDRTVRVHCHLDAEDDRLIPGMYVKAEIKTTVNKKLTVPESAIVSSDGTSHIFLADDANHFTLVPVKIDITNDGLAALSEWNFPEDQKVVVEGSYVLLSLLKNTGDED